jgi:hypothetical protein
MGAVQQTAVFNAVQGLKGEGLTFNCKRLWDTLVAGDARWYPYCPIDDSTANALAYQMELFTASAAGTFVGFVLADFSPQQLIGGSGKYLRTGIAPNAYPQDGIFAASYNREESLTANVAFFGSCDLQTDVFTNTNNAVFIASAFSNRLSASANGGRVSQYSYAISSVTNKQTGVVGVSRLTSFDQRGYVDNEMRPMTAGNVDVFSVSPSALEFYVHAANGSAGVHRPSAAPLCGFISAPVSNLSEIDQIKYVFNRFQAEVITGGRDV